MGLFFSGSKGLLPGDPELKTYQTPQVWQAPPELQRDMNLIMDQPRQESGWGSFKPNDLSALVGEAPRRNRGGFGDVLATVLSVAADAANPEAHGAFSRNLAKQWGERRENYDKSRAAYQGRQQIAALPGMTQRELASYMADPKAWGSHMADAATSRFQAATLNPGDQRFLGEGNGVYQAPTRGQQFAGSLGLEPGSEAYSTALRDQELGAQGPTAFSNTMDLEATRQHGRSSLEQQRQQGRANLEGVRQGNRVNLRKIPTVGRIGPPPPRRALSGAPKVPTATDGKGNTIYLRGGKWVDAQGRAVQ